MGVGDPISIVEAVALGVDMFDCVLPTRLARHGTALTGVGRVHIKSARFRDDGGPLDPACSCPVCARYSRGYLRHLLQVGEPTGGRLLTLHNLRWMLDLFDRIHQAVASSALFQLRSEVRAIWGPASLG
jgi:queuine tRNA-ribosyltransferase